MCYIYICHRSSYSDSEPARMLPHSRFSVVIMVNPRSWSTLDGAVDSVPVLSAPCFHVEKFLWKSPDVIPGLYIHCYCSIAIVIPDTLRRSAASTALSKNDLGSINRLSFRTVLESKGQYVRHLCKISGLNKWNPEADPGFFLGGGTPLRNYHFNYHFYGV